MGARDKGCEACLDDFILLGPPGTNHCARDVERVLETFHDFGGASSREQAGGTFNVPNGLGN